MLLTGWKAIAGHLQTSVRTVQRWEADEALPVRRVKRTSRDAVEAETGELEAWLERRTRPMLGSLAFSASVAVLPFAAAGEGWLGEEVAAELIQELAMVPGLRVHGRTSSFRLAAGGCRGKEVAQELGATAWVEGEVLPREEEAGWTVNARLVGGEEGVIWAGRWDGAGLRRRDVVEGICSTLRLRLPVEAASGELALRAGLVQKWLRARSLFVTLEAPKVAQAVGLAEEVRREQPEFGMVLADLGAYYCQTALMGMAPVGEAVGRSEAVLEEARRRAPGNADTWLWSARNAVLFRYDWKGAEVMYRRALELAPGHMLARFFYAGDLLRTLGRQEEALEQARRGQRADPLNPLGFLTVAQIQAARGRFREALEETEKGNRIQPHWTLDWVRGAVLLRLGRLEEAYEVLREVVGAAPPHCWVEPTYVNACWATGREEEARERVDRAEDDRMRYPVPASTLGLLQAVVGNRERALDWFETALEERDPALIFQLRASAGVIVMPEVESLVYGEERWRAVVRAMGLG